MTVVYKNNWNKSFTRIVRKVIRNLKMKDAWISVENTKALYEKNYLINSRPYEMTLKLKNDVKECDDLALQYFLLSPEKICYKDKIIIYIHGGAWTKTIFKYHWWFLDKLVKQNGINIYVPIYHKYPNYCAADTITSLFDFYKSISIKNEGKKIVLMGDSAGAHLCLVLAKLIEDEKISNLEQLILFSAPTDLNLCNPKIKKIEKKDPMLYSLGLKMTIDNWVKPDGIELYNPMSFEYKKPLKITHFIGTNDILYPDSLIFDEKMMKMKVEIKTYVYRAMYHVFPVTPNFESKLVRLKIQKLLKNKR